MKRGNSYMQLTWAQTGSIIGAVDPPTADCGGLTELLEMAGLVASKEE